MGIRRRLASANRTLDQLEGDLAEQRRHRIEELDRVEASLNAQIHALWEQIRELRREALGHRWNYN